MKGLTGCRPFPDTFPSEEAGTIIVALRNPGAADPLSVAHCGLTLVDYGLGLMSKQPVPTPITSMQSCSSEALAQHLEHCKDIWDRPDGMKAGAEASIPWAIIIPAVLQLIQTLLARQ